MADWKVALIGVGAFFAYFIMAGLTQRAVARSVDEDGPLGLIWPFLLPWKLGDLIVSLVVGRRPKLPKATVERDNSL